MWRTRIARTLTVLLVAFCPIVLSRGQVHAANCTGTGCDSQNPGAMGCLADANYDNVNAYFTNANNQSVGNTWLGHSSSCGTFWAHVVLNSNQAAAQLVGNATGNNNPNSTALGVSNNATYILDGPMLYGRGSGWVGTFCGGLLSTSSSHYSCPSIHQ